ncbi:ATP-dependent RNA helicase [Wolffia australiana]
MAAALLLLLRRPLCSPAAAAATLPLRRLSAAAAAANFPQIPGHLPPAAPPASAAEQAQLAAVLRHFAQSGWAADQALAIYLPAALFPAAAKRFSAALPAAAAAEPSLLRRLLAAGPSPAADRLLFPLFADFALRHFPRELSSHRSLVLSADLTSPHAWFPFARAMRRRVVYHCGPTNSGKTFAALRAFAAARRGLYCSPLRLLAMEVFDRVNAAGVYCNLVTGQERTLVPFAEHTACTMEMASTEELYEVAVLDEVQMLADPSRGWAWTRALLGVRADEVHLCGDPSVAGLVRRVCGETGDELVEVNYGRFKPLVVEGSTLGGDLTRVRPGDCVVAFSRREIFEVKLAVERLAGHRCCVIYGALPPETRRQQAALFNEEGSGYDVLVASDAVGMGLNLNIRRVVFYSLAKYDGDRVVPVAASQVKQIAGRAGRRGSRYPDGLVTTFAAADLEYLVECLQRPFEEAPQAGLFPLFEQVELFASQFPELPFSQLLDRFRQSCRLDGCYFFCRHDQVRKVAALLDRVPGLSLQDRFNFCFAPVNTRDPKVMNHLLRFAVKYGERRPVGIALGMPRASARSDAELLDMEAKHQVLSAYLWLAHHFEQDTFPQADRAQEMAAAIAELLGQSLARVTWKPEPPRRKRRPDDATAAAATAADDSGTVYFPEDEFDSEHATPRPRLARGKKGREGGDSSSEGTAS